MAEVVRHVYVHVPYCRQICHYCNYHSRASLKNRHAMLAAMKKEALIASQRVETGELKTLYFGGGTPSVLEIEELAGLMDAVKHHFTLSSEAEITLEANPDDLSGSYIEGLQHLGFNRLSIGVQSFFDDDLRWMNRRHSAREAIQSVKKAQKLGFHNINIDLMYGLPTMTPERWHTNLKQAIDLDVSHLSAYHLIIEERSVFGKRQGRGEVFSVAEEESINQFYTLVDMTGQSGYEHYEISNFARPGFRSQHNTAHWLLKPYIGIGPAAHSFDGKSRQWNISNNSKYIDALENDAAWFEREELTPIEKYNEYVLISIRAAWGVDINYIRTIFGAAYEKYFLQHAVGYLQNDYMQEQAGIFTLTRKGKMAADGIASDLFFLSI